MYGGIADNVQFMHWGLFQSTQTLINQSLLNVQFSLVILFSEKKKKLIITFYPVKIHKHIIAVKKIDELYKKNSRIFPGQSSENSKFQDKPQERK